MSPVAPQPAPCPGSGEAIPEHAPTGPLPSVAVVVLAACQEQVDGLLDLDTPLGDSLARVLAELGVEDRLPVTIPAAEQLAWQTPRELVAIVERAMGGAR